jgi:peptidoglycan/LPS O-acetylase OafA/YrhL
MTENSLRATAGSVGPVESTGSMANISMPGAAKSELRPDIQALRGVAVLLVVLYHAGISAVGGGYLGVDVFFVVSGYLITGLIARGLERGNFSFREFYYRRAKRLLPSAYVVILATVVLAPFVISDVAFEEMKTQVWGAVTFTANFVLWQQSGYFDNAADTKPLLHFWSLAIEEQYYLVMPLLLFLLPRRLWTVVLSLITVVSAVGCVWLAQHDPGAAFYLSPVRAWELGLGSLLAVAPTHRIPAWLRSWARLPALVVLLYVAASPSGLPHPSLDALLVTLATAVIIAGMNGAALERSAPVRGLAFLGDFSYSLYLVHWPVLVFTRAAWLESAPAWAMYIAVLVSLLLSYLLYRFVEEPFRRGFFTRKIVFASSLATVTFISALSPVAVGAVSASGQDFDFIRRQNLGLSRECGFGERYPFTGEIPADCETKPHPKILVWGDSYARAWTTAIMDHVGDEGLAQVTMARCDPFYGASRLPKDAAPGSQWDRTFSEGCIKFGEDVVDLAVRHQDIETVILAARFQTVFSEDNIFLVRDDGQITEHEPSLRLVADRLIKSVQLLRAAGKKVVIMAPPPANGTDIGECWERKQKHKITFGGPASCDLSYESVMETRAITFELLDIVSKEADVGIVELYDFFCDGIVCKTEMDGVLLFRDVGHMTVEGAKLVGEKTNLAQKVLAAAR